MKKMISKILVLLLILGSVTGLGTVSTEAATSGGYTYTVNTDNTITITAYSGTEKSVVIPDTLDGKSVTAIGESAFFAKTSITSITLPSTLKSIGEMAFAMTGITSITLPEGLTSIETAAFAMTGITSIKTPDSMTTIGTSAFAMCPMLTSVQFGSQLTTIEEGAFMMCTSLPSVTLPATLTSLGKGAFSGCTALKSYNVDGANPYFKSISNIIYSKDGTTLVSFTPGSEATSYKTPSGVTVVGKYAFAGTDLETITLSEGVKTLEEGAFAGCIMLSTVKFATTLTTIGKDAFLDCWSLEKITLPDTLTSIGTHAFGFESDISDTDTMIYAKTDGFAMYCTSAAKAAINYGKYSGINYYVTDRDIRLFTVTISKTEYTYDGSAKKPAITVKYGSKTLVNGTDYTVTYSKNTAIGKATATIKGKGLYTGTVQKTFKINPGKTTASVKAGSKSATISWSKLGGVDGYQVYMSTSKNGTYTKINTATTTSFKKTGLTSGKTYYFKVRAYKKVDVGNSYGAYSAIVSVKVK